MNNRMFELLQGHVIACNHILISHYLLKTFPSQVFIFIVVDRNTSGWLSRDRGSGLGRGDFNGHRRVYIMDLDGQLRCRRGRKARLDNPRLGRPVLRLLVSLMIGKVSQVQRLGQGIPFISHKKTRLRLSLWPGYLVHHLLSLVLFHDCHPWKEKC